MNEWLPYPGEYEKEWYDIKLKDGRIWYNVWPNAGKFHNIHGDGAYVKEEYVTHFRIHQEDQ
jgi:hypothetical protein